MVGLWVLHETDLSVHSFLNTHSVHFRPGMVHAYGMVHNGRTAVLKTLSSGQRPLHLWACLSRHDLCGVWGALKVVGASEEPRPCCSRCAGKKIYLLRMHQNFISSYLKESVPRDLLFRSCTLVGGDLSLEWERITQFGSRREGWKTLWLIERFYMYSNLGRTEPLGRGSGQLQWWMDGSVCFGFFDLSSCF